ncbi:uncharacterized protein LOC105632964 isoform X2 [Jatropha curcas]|uniref:uncharacterized protein LOC105632964 isoform X2 n=1 Tax=Jatropha curcas TaxID=180498 RepID=UPI0009D6AABD|nr:uncharacterized protein LOC105632964 isoform X2 [Jatropha curcas]
MEEGKAAENIASLLKKVDLNPNFNRKSSYFGPTFQSSRLIRKRTEPPSLVSLCLGVVGKHLEDIIADLSEIVICFPAQIKMAIAAISRRRKLLNDDVIISLADSSWEILDLSGSDVTDSGLMKVAELCKFLRAVDIRGCPRSDYTARNCLSILKPKLNDIEGDSWEELDTAEIGHGAESLRWLVWPKIDNNSMEILATECPRIIVNPKPSPFGFRGIELPIEALADIALDDSVVKDIDPKTWAVCGFTPRPVAPSASSPSELSMAEKFRLAFVERDTRLAPKRAKNARQHQRRAEREWMMTSTEGKALALASKARRSLHNKN